MARGSARLRAVPPTPATRSLLRGPRAPRAVRRPLRGLVTPIVVTLAVAGGSACVVEDGASVGGTRPDGALDTNSPYDGLYAAPGPGGTTSTVFGLWKLEQDVSGHRVEIRLRLEEQRVQLATRCFVGDAAVTPGVSVAAVVTEQAVVVQEAALATLPVNGEVCQVQLTAGQAQLILANGQLTLGGSYTFPVKVSD